MNNLLTTVFSGLEILFIISVFLWILVPLITGLPWVPTRDTRIHRALQLADVRPGEVVYDLGAGDGRVLVAAARDFEARAVGIEISPVHCLLAIIRARLAGVGRQVTVRPGSFYHADFSDADVVYAYLTFEQAARLRPTLESSLRKGTRVVTISSDIDGWQPEQIDRQELIFLYRMPPSPGNIASFLACSMEEKETR